ncbi:MAG: hypothetical protein A2W68_15210 [Betaproteobacteria bacterium RIFCSPLOWO2_02_64_14]|nr:MAG: hypothetical protein A2W68_15210 [Betaproteobacteria bacterium RIFCSPLOWO2_02_64_14]
MTPDDAANESPCVRVCVIDPATGYCCGCYRTLDEISFWMRYTPQERRRVMQHLQARRTVAAGARIMD